LAKKQAAEDKARLRKEYISVGGDPDSFDDFYEREMPRIIAERLIERERRIARPGRDY
jgi:hypothetical protein